MSMSFYTKKRSSTSSDRQFVEGIEEGKE